MSVRPENGLRGALLVAGTTSDAGKSVLVAGICRLLARHGVRVAPFKAQNMSNNSMVTPDGGEIGRAQGIQALACGLAPSARFNPVLLKPGGERCAQLVVAGRAQGVVQAGEYFAHRTWLRQVVAHELTALRDEFDVVICEGAGSPAEINLRDTDIANMGLAQSHELPVLVVGDIDRGGVLAHLFGTLAVLDPADQRLIAGFLINKFRGERDLLQPGLRQLTALTGRPTLGVLPFSEHLWLDAEDSLGAVADAPVGRSRPPRGSQWLSVAAIRLPRLSNSTDIEALASEPGVAVRWVSDPARLVGADLVVLPGTKATVADLDWLRRTGLADAVAAHAAAGRPLLGICGGYQMLGARIRDAVESDTVEVSGLGLCDVDVEFAAHKTVRPARGVGAEGAASAGVNWAGYEVHHGQVCRSTEPPWLLLAAAERGDDPAQRATPQVAEGVARTALWGTHVHGLLESDDFRRAWLTQVAQVAGRTGFVPAADTSFHAHRTAQLDHLADLVAEHVDLPALWRLISAGVPPELPTIRSSAAGAVL